MDRYEVVINGCRTTLQLSDAEAKARGLLDESATKQRSAANKAAKAPANKGKTTAQKRAEAAASAFGGGSDAGSGEAGDSGDGSDAGDDGTGAAEDE